MNDERTYKIIGAAMEVHGTDGRRQTAESRGQRTESIAQSAEGREQKAKGRGKKGKRKKRDDGRWTKRRQTKSEL